MRSPAQRRADRKIRARAAEAGICTRCLTNQAVVGGRYCSPCLEYAKNRRLEADREERCKRCQKRDARHGSVHCQTCADYFKYRYQAAKIGHARGRATVSSPQPYDLISEVEPPGLAATGKGE